MHRKIAVVSLLTILAGVGAAQEGGPVAPPQKIVVIDPAQPEQKRPEQGAEPVYDEKADGAEQIAAALDSAKKNNRRVLIQWGANWCGWCVKLHDLCRDNGELRQKLLYEYDVVHLDVGQFDKHLDLAAKYGADLRGNGIPFLTILDADGNAIANQETGSLESAAGGATSHDVAKVMAFLTEHQAEYRSATAILDDGLARARAEGKTALVHFGAPWCVYCHKLEAFLAREDIAPIFEERIVEIGIDTERTIGGGDMLLEMRGSQMGGIPWFAFVDGSGDQIVASSSQGENIGFPMTAEEVAAFLGMLRQVKPAFTQEQLVHIEGVLAQPRK